MGSVCPLVDLPDELLEAILKSCPTSQRSFFARTCTTMRRVHDNCRWSFLRCSMNLLFRRGRYAETPHWTADLFVLRRVLRRPMFAHLRHLVLHLDMPCFEHGLSPWIHPEHKASFEHGALRTLEILGTRSGKCRTASSALFRIVQSFPYVHSVTLKRIGRVGCDTVNLLLKKSRPLEHLALHHCTFTDAARRSVTMFLATGPRWNGVLCMAWPDSLTSLELSGTDMSKILKTVSRILDDRPLHLPPSTRALHMGTVFDALSDFQAVVSVAVLTRLKRVTMHSDCIRLIMLLETHRRIFFPELKICLQV